MRITITNQIHVTDIPEAIELEAKRQLTVTNPAYSDAVKMNRWMSGIPEHIFCYQKTETGLIVPRGFIRQLTILAKQHCEPFEWTDKTRELAPVDFQFKGKLRQYQEQAATAVLRRRFGVLQAPTGSGKTIIGLAVIAQRKSPALIVVHTKELLNQWIARIHSFLGIPVDEIGVIGGGKMRIGERITVAMVQSLYKCAHEVSPHVGHVIMDECHRTPSRTFTEAVTTFDSRYLLGLSATAYRRDGLSKLIYWHIGDQVHSIGHDELTDNGAILRFHVKTVETNFTTSLDPSAEYSKMLSELTRGQKRNRLICSEAAQQANNGGGIPLILSDRKAHCITIAEALDRDFNIHADLLTGDLPKKAREKVVAKLNAGDCETLISTTQLLSEGFDLPSLGAVVLATPIRFKGRLIQAIGRALRPSPGQDMATVVDFVDSHVGVLKHSAKKRLKVYRSLGAGGCS